MTAQTIMGLTRVDERRSHGFDQFDGAELLTPRTRACAGSAANEISMIFQDPMTSLNPFYKIGKQIVEPMQAHRDVYDEEA